MGRKRRELEGTTVGRWAVLEYIGGKLGKYSCQCECGTRKEVRSCHLLSEVSMSCGCITVERLASQRVKIEDSENKYGRLKPIKYLGEDKYMCLCDCGVNTIARGKDMRNGHTKSCGCYMVR